jgi:uncharacterized RDD family membrane protein YckC
MTVAMPAEHGHPPDALHRGTYAGIVTRGTAFVIDSMLVVVGWAVALFVTQSLVSLFNLGDGQIQSALEAFLAGFAGLISFFIYNVFCLVVFGKTVGMMLLGLRVVRADGRKPGVLRAAVRTLAYALSFILMLGFIWIAIDNRRQAWHDKIARTFVVYDWDLRGGRALSIRLDDPLVPHG